MRATVSTLIVAGTAATAELAAQTLPGLAALGVDMADGFSIGVSVVLGAFGGSVRGVLRPVSDRPVRFWVYPLSGSFVALMASLFMVGGSFHAFTSWAASGALGYVATKVLDAIDPVVEGLPAIFADVIRARLIGKEKRDE